MIKVLLFLISIGIAYSQESLNQSIINEKLARDIYENYYLFYNREIDGFDSFTTNQFQEILKKEYNCPEICAISFDPWLNVQDGEIRKPVEFQTVKKTEFTTVIEMTYIFWIAEERQIKQKVAFKFERTKIDTGWKLSDFIVPDGTSLKNLMINWHNKY